MRFLPLALTIALACTATTALAQNENTTLPMHAIVTSFGPCPIPTGDPCDPGPPTVNVGVGSQIAAYLLARNYNDMAGVQTAFDWGAWALAFGLWDCQGNQLSATTPSGAGGATDGTIATAFDCVQGGTTAIIGRLHLIPTSLGCIEQIESSFPEGTHMVDCTAIPTPINELNRGSICAGSDGIDACEPAVPVEPTTWGTIKSQYVR